MRCEPGQCIAGSSRRSMAARVTASTAVLKSVDCVGHASITSRRSASFCVRSCVSTVSARSKLSWGDSPNSAEGSPRIRRSCSALVRLTGPRVHSTPPRPKYRALQPPYFAISYPNSSAFPDNCGIQPEERELLLQKMRSRVRRGFGRQSNRLNIERLVEERSSSLLLGKITQHERRDAKGPPDAYQSLVATEVFGQSRRNGGQLSLKSMFPMPAEKNRVGRETAILRKEDRSFRI